MSQISQEAGSVEEVAFLPDGSRKDGVESQLANTRVCLVVTHSPVVAEQAGRIVRLADGQVARPPITARMLPAVWA
jgi:hypothetical protein